MSSIKQAIDYAFDGKVSEMSDELNSALLQKVSDMIMGKRQEIAQSLITPTNEAKEDEEEEEDEDESDEEYIKHPNGWSSIRSKRKEDDEEEVKYNPKKKPIGESEMSSAQKAKEEKLKAKYDSSDMKKNMIDQYGKEKGEQVYFAKIRKMAMEEVEDIEEDMFSRKMMSYKRPDKYMAKQKRKLRKRTV